MGWERAPRQPLFGHHWEVLVTSRGELRTWGVSSGAEDPVRGSIPLHAAVPSVGPFPGPQPGLWSGCQLPSGQGQGQLATASAQDLAKPHPHVQATQMVKEGWTATPAQSCLAQRVDTAVKTTDPGVHKF